MEQVLCCMYCLDSKMITPSSPLFEHLNYSVQRIIPCRDQAVFFPPLKPSGFNPRFSSKLKGLSGQSLTAGGRGFPLAAMNITPGYLHKEQKKKTQRDFLVV